MLGIDLVRVGAQSLPKSGPSDPHVALDSAVRLAERPSTSPVDLFLNHRQYASSCFLRIVCCERLLLGFFGGGPTYLWLQVLEETNVLRNGPVGGPMRRDGP